MSDYGNGSKNYGTSMYPVHANGTSGLLRRAEPLLTPTQLKSRHLKGILELAARFNISWTEDELKDQINLAANQAEIELGVNILPEQCKEKHPFDYQLYKAFIHMRTEQGPIASIEELAIVSSSGENIFTVPSQWIEAAQFHQRQVNVIPLLSTFGTTSVNTPVASGGIAYLTLLLQQMGWVPSYWQIKYTAGMSNTEGQVPVLANTLIGIVAAMNLLSMIAPVNFHTSVSISQDGIGQSSSNSGPQIFLLRMQELEKQKAIILKQLKRVFSMKYFLGVI